MKLGPLFAMCLLVACGPAAGGGNGDDSDSGVDSDGDSISDTDEGREGSTDTDHDGTPDFEDDDSDGDGIPDYREAGDADAAYILLTGSGCGAPDNPGAPPGNFVRPGHPESSQLMHLLRGEGGLIMPPDSPLPDVEIEIVERWILEGATCD